jgi:hypothetical protein
VAPAAAPAEVETDIAIAPVAVQLCQTCHAELAAGAALCRCCGSNPEKPPAPAPNLSREELAPLVGNEANEKAGYEAQEDEEPVRRRPGQGVGKRTGPPRTKRERQEQFNWTCLGLNFYYAKLAGSVGSICLLFFAFRVVLSGDLPAGMFVFLGLEPALGFVTALLGATGSVLCCWAPPRIEVRPLARALLAIDGATAALRFPSAALGALALSAAGGAGLASAAILFGALAFLGGLASLVLFLFFLRRLTYFLGRDDLRDETMSILLALVAVLVCTFFGTFLIGGALVRFPSFGRPLSYLGTLVLLAAIGKVWFRLFHLLRRVQRLAQARATRSPRSLLSEVPVWAWGALPVTALALLAGWVGLMALPGLRGAPTAGPVPQVATAGRPGPAAPQPGPPKQPAAPPKPPTAPPMPPAPPPPKVPPPATDFPGLLGYWALDEGEGTRAADSSGHGRHATAVKAQWADGVRGKALRLSGKDSYLDYSDSPAFSFAAGAPFTLALWVQTTEGGGTLLSQRRHGDGTPLLDIDFGGGFGDGRLQFHVRQDGHGLFYGNIKGGAINDGRWHHVAATRSGGDLELFLDGVSQGRATDRMSAGPITTDWRALGSERHHSATGFPAANPHFKGCLDEFCIFGRVLRPEEIAKLAGR